MFNLNCLNQIVQSAQLRAVRIKKLMHAAQFCLFSHFTFFQENRLIQFASRHKNVLIIASIAFGLLAAYFLAARSCFKENPIKGKIIGPAEEIKPRDLHGESNENALHKALAEIAPLSGDGSDRFGVYVTTNDFDFENSKEELNVKCPENGIHIGCAAWHNLDIMSFRQSS